MKRKHSKNTLRQLNTLSAGTMYMGAGEKMFFYWCPGCAEKSPRGSGGMPITQLFFLLLLLFLFFKWCNLVHSGNNFIPGIGIYLCMNSIK